MSFNFQIDPLQFISDNWTALTRQFQFFRDPKLIISQLTKAMIKLRGKREDVNDRIILAEHDGLTQTNEVRVWLGEVTAIDAEVSQIKTELENGSFRWCINSRAAQKLAEIGALTKTSFDIVATKLPPKGVQEVPVEPLTTTPTTVTYLSQLQAFIQDDESRTMGIWGMGGVGKTTLLSNFNNKLCSSEAGQTPPMFDHVIWVVASKDYDVGKLQHDITEQLGLPQKEDNKAQAKLIMDFLKNKKFLLLLDDLWQPVDFNDLGIPQLQGTRPTKRKMVFTTRSEDVCALMQAQRKMKLECLNDEEAWQLFKEKVSEETLQANVGIPHLARKVARECDGLPLALVVIGTAMSMKKTTMEWQNAITLLQKSRSYEIHNMVDKILLKLKFSYDNLPDDIFRRCFLLCSLWPEDFSVEKIELIECWMGHGLVDERNFDSINEAYDSGHALIGGLQAACLLEQGNDKDKEVKMHDVVRDLALWITSDCGENPNNFIVCSGFNASQGEVKRISLIHGNFSGRFGLPSNCSKLETFMVGNSSLRSIVTGFFHGTPALAYLDISYTDISDLPKEIGELVNLRYLNISSTCISHLPVELGKLRELRFLLLRDMLEINIPSGLLEKLVMLSMIDMTRTWCNNSWKELAKVPGYLKGVGINLESIEDLRQLALFPNVLIWRLGLNNLMGFNGQLQLLSPSQLGSRNIRSSIQMLIIEFCDSLQVVSMESDGDGNGQKWNLSRLEKLELMSLPELKEIVWRGVCPAEMLPSLTVLKISNCNKFSNISWVIRLPSLEELDVCNCSKMEQVVDDDNEIGLSGEEENVAGTPHSAFPSLKRLRLENLESLTMFGGSFTFPALEVLRVSCCPQMQALPFGKEMVGRELKAIQGDREWWERLDMEDGDKVALLPYFHHCADVRILTSSIMLYE